MSVFLELNITDDHPGLTDSAAPRTHSVRPAGVILDVRGAAALTLHGRHLLFTICNNSNNSLNRGAGAGVIRENYYVRTVTVSVTDLLVTIMKLSCPVSSVLFCQFDQSPGVH